MITIPMKSKNNITYKEKLAQKTDYVIIVNDENSSNVSDLFIIWNQKAKVFISSGIKVLTIFFVCTYNDELKIPSSIAKLDINSEFDFLRNSVFIQSFNFFLEQLL